MRWYLVEVNGFLFQQHHCVLFLVAVPIPSQHRFPTFSPNSPIIWHSNPIAPAYSHASNMGVTYTRSNFFEKIKEKEKDTQIYFSYVFYNGKKNGNGIFSMKKKTNILFYFFHICWEFNGYLFNIVLVIYNVITANRKPFIIISLIVYEIKNYFTLQQKCMIWDNFLAQKI